MKRKLTESELGQRRKAAKQPRKSLGGKDIYITMPDELLEQLPKESRARNNAIREAVRQFLESKVS